MSWPASWYGRIDFDSTDPNGDREALIKRSLEKLEERKAKWSQRQGADIRFTGSLFRTIPAYFYGVGRSEFQVSVSESHVTASWTMSFVPSLVHGVFILIPLLVVLVFDLVKDPVVDGLITGFVAVALSYLLVIHQLLVRSRFSKMINEAWQERLHD